MSDDIGRTAVAIIRDLMGPTASLSATNCRVVEDHLRALVAAVNALPTLLDRLSAMPAAGESSDMPVIWEDPAGKGYPCFSRPMTPREARQTIERDGERIVALEEVIRDTLWMACRYAHGRQSYAVGMYNAAARKAQALGALENRPASDEPIFAIDDSLSREMSGLTEPEFEAAWAGWHKDDAIPQHCRPGFAARAALGGEG